MSKIKIKEIASCTLNYCKENNIQPVIISLTLSFGKAPTDTFETPSLLISVLTKNELLEMQKEEHFAELIWNHAEYEHQEIAYNCIDTFFSKKSIHSQIYFDREYSEQYFVDLFISLKNEFLDYIVSKSTYNPLVYVYHLDNHIYTDIIESNFNKTEIQGLKVKYLY